MPGVLRMLAVVWFLLASVSAWGAAASTAPADRYAGRFVGEFIIIELQRADGRYTGTLHFEDEQFPVEARDTGVKLEGTFEDKGEKFAFTAILDGSTLMLSTDGTTYELRKQPANPLAQRAKNPLAAPKKGDRDQSESAPGEGEGRESRLPEGYQVKRAGSGQVLIAHKDTGRSARGLLSEAIAELSGYFDGRPRVSGAFADKQDREAQASFLAESNGTAVNGLAFASLRGEGGTVAVVFDTPEALPGSLQGLVDIAQQSLPQLAAQPVQWQQVSLPDGSGTMRLPQGWRITSATKGMVDVEGPEGAGAAFGIWVPVNTPESVMPQYRDMLVVAPYLGPAEALVELWPQLNRLIVQGGGDPANFVRIIEQTPTQYPGGQAAFLHYEADRITGGQAVRYRVLALVITAQTSPTTWMYYFSQVVAPEQGFKEKLPVMLEIWKSWKVSDAELRRRLDEAIGNLREANAIYQSAQRNRERVMENAQADWIEYIRGTRDERDTLTGEMRQQPLHEIEDIVEEKNRVAGYQRYEQMPLRELNRE